ncbi:MAG TPA: hypothetical protein VLG27_04320 [Candidatus Saccharimonadia bacterium]|nr:hypothetical protein [Candidatus Saccharimonadia bacterium]
MSEVSEPRKPKYFNREGLYSLAAAAVTVGAIAVADIAGAFNPLRNKSARTQVSARGKHNVPTKPGSSTRYHFEYSPAVETRLSGVIDPAMQVVENGLSDKKGSQPGGIVSVKPIGNNTEIDVNTKSGRGQDEKIQLVLQGGTHTQYGNPRPIYLYMITDVKSRSCLSKVFAGNPMLETELVTPAGEAYEKGLLSGNASDENSYGYAAVVAGEEYPINYLDTSDSDYFEELECGTNINYTGGPVPTAQAIAKDALITSYNHILNDLLTPPSAK